MSASNTQYYAVGKGSHAELTTEPNTAIIKGFQDSRTVRELHDLAFQPALWGAGPAACHCPTEVDFERRTPWTPLVCERWGLGRCAS